MQGQIDDSVADAALVARAQMPTGEWGLFCTLCDKDMLSGRRYALLGVRTCVTCQSGRDCPRAMLFNRRGSKDSQLW